ncbi:MAG: hypothetical protein K2F57_07190 [Candidatus Gastranaerophilales bacterium]|nr:hypothetical protein [Candidatus Gastranaerophilales bacterium]
MVVEIENPANKNMHYGDKLPVGVISAPERLPKRTLYSNYEAEKSYNQLQYDIYQSQKHTKPPKKGKFPTVLKILLGTITAGCAIIFKKDIFRFIKNIKNPFR